MGTVSLGKGANVLALCTCERMSCVKRRIITAKMYHMMSVQQLAA